jgi:hypothetical protein
MDVVWFLRKVVRIVECSLLFLPMHHLNAQVKPEGDNDLQEHEYGSEKGAQGVTIHDDRKMYPHGNAFSCTMIHDADAMNGKYPSLQVLQRHLNATTHQNNNG